MRARSIKQYLRLGYNLRYLLDVSTNHLVYGDKHVLETIHVFIQSCSDAGLYVTSRAATELYAPLIERWESASSTVKTEGLNLSLSDAAAVKEASYQLQTVLFSEAQGVFAYVARDKRYPVDRLLDDVASLMSPGIFEALPAVARYDFKEAGRCIAFELPTAAAFHLMRATEDVLKSFYRALVPDGRAPLMWGPMVQDLRRTLDPAPSVLLNNLDHLRTGFRNPTQHPEKIYDIEEVQDLFSLSVDATNRMLKYLDPSRGEYRPL
jgi:hypothetical protein